MELKHDTNHEVFPDRTLIDEDTKARAKVFPIKALKREAEAAWQTAFHADMSAADQGRILEAFPHSIAPWFTKPELLMDFVMDAFNSEGSLSIVALSSIFQLMQDNNLDYPQFYQKVYSLINCNILHSKHRTSFLRHLHVFLMSTHLPAALIASFMKKLSRLCLYAPPSSIIAIVPWIYNSLKDHPMCAFMIQRVFKENRHRQWSIQGIGEDPFDDKEVDPMRTNAIDSSLWEIETLQSHYHPNVAVISRIISEQFTKQSYKVEDFMEHSYEGMLEGETMRPLKKPPVVEYQIPKRVFTRHSSDHDNDESLLTSMWDFTS